MADIATLGIRLDASGAIQDLQQFGNAAANTAKQADLLERSVRMVTGALAAYKAAQYGTEALTLAARYETLGIAMNVVGHNAGYSAQQMDSFDAGLRKTGISMIESRNNLARMSAAQLDLAKSMQLGRVAQDAAVIAGINSSEAFERLVQGIVSGQPRILHTMGLFADFGREERKWAEAHNRTADELTQVEKVNIRLSATLEEGARRAGVYEAAMDTAGKQLQSAKRYAEDLQVKLGEAFKPEFTTAVFLYTDALKLAGQHAQGLAVAMQNIAIVGVGAGLMKLMAGGTIATAFQLAAEAEASWANAAALAGAATVGLGTKLGTMAMTLGPLLLLVGAAELAIYDLNKAFEDYDANLEEANRNTPQYVAYLKALGEARAHAPDPASAPDAERGAHAQKYAALKEEREQELGKQTALNAAFGQSANALKVLDIEYDAAIERAKNAKEHRGEELITLNALTDGLARQKIVAAELAADQQRRDSVRDVGIDTDAHIRAAQQETALIGLRADAIGRQRIENDALNSSIEARVELAKALEHADANEAQTALSIYDNTLLRIAAVKALAIAQQQVQVASATLEIRAHAEAIEVENRALANGAASRKDYQANLDAELAGRKALREIGFGDPIALALRLAAIEQERREKVALVELKEATTEHDRAVKEATANAKHFAAEQQHIAQVLENDLLHAIQSFTTNGLQSFKSFFTEVEHMSFQMVGQLDEHLTKLANEKRVADAAGPAFADQSQKISDDIAKFEQLRKAAAAAAVVVSAAMGGYQIGQQLYSGSHSGAQNTAEGALGGAASGALAGSAFGAPGIAAGALIGLTAGIIGVGHAAAEAAKAMADLQTSLKLSMDALRAQVNKDTLGQSIAAVNANREQLRKQIEDAYAGGGADSQQVATRMAALKDMNALEDQRIAQLRQEADAAKALAAQQQQRDQEDLSVRLLAAQGYTQASSDAAFRNQQQREYQDAVAANRSPEYLQLLTSAQMQEAILRATERDVASQTTVIQEANKAQQLALDAQLKTAQDALQVGQAQLNTAQQSVQALQQVVTNLANFRDSLKLSNLSPLSPTEQLAEAKRQLDADYAKAQGGDQQAGNDFANIAKAFLTASREVNASGTAYASDFAAVQQMTDALQGKFGTQLTAEQQIVAQLTAANAALQAQIAATTAAKAAAQAAADAQVAALQASLTQDAALSSAQVAVLQANRQAVLDANAAAVAAVNAGKDAATIDNLRQVAAVDQSRVDMNDAAFRQEDALTAQRAVLERQIAQIRAGEDAQAQQSDAALQKMIDQEAALDKQKEVIENARIQANARADAQLAALFAIRDKEWTATVRIDPQTPTGSGGTTGGGRVFFDVSAQGTEATAAVREGAAATVAVLQAGLSALVARVEDLTTRVEENTKVTKRGFEGLT